VPNWRLTLLPPAAASRRHGSGRHGNAASGSRQPWRACRSYQRIKARNAKGHAGKPPAEARASSTDPDATVMKMADGGFRPAYNVQFATDTASQVIVGVGITTAGSDHDQLLPMVDQIKARYDRAPDELLVDGGFVNLAEFETLALTACGSTIYAPVPTPRDTARDPHLPLPGDTPAVAAWRTRMGTPEAQLIYRERAASAECVNAQARNRGLRQIPVRGLARATAIPLWQALAHNLLRAVTLRPVEAVMTS
jgi:hypothetical protein